MIKILAFTFIISSVCHASEFTHDIASSLLQRTTQQVTYDGAYRSIGYPNGDVPANIGVCTDVLIRAYRTLGTDLQKLVHEDMRDNFSVYPSQRMWGLKSTDKNIDHRRVPNLQVFFARHAAVLPLSEHRIDYTTGDIVTWLLPGNLPHIGMVSDKKNAVTGNPMIVHNIGQGPKLEDMMFDYKITGHYRYIPDNYR